MSGDSISLINGRGQIGERLGKLLSNELKEHEKEVYIYHTWNVLDKSEKRQKKEYDKFVDFVDNNATAKIIFVSTTSQRETYYTHYKQLSEAYLVMHCEKGIVVRLPMLIGKGVLPNIKSGKMEPYGKMELITIEDASMEIIKLIDYEGVIKIFSIKGTEIDSQVVKEVLSIEEITDNEQILE